MKRYLVFTYTTYYPSGGKDDVQGSFDTIEEVLQLMMEQQPDYTDILDMEERRWYKGTCDLGYGSRDDVCRIEPVEE